MQAYPQHVPVMKRGIAKAARGDVFTTEVKMERTGYPTAFLDVSVQPVRGPEEEIVYLLFEARDITELKTAQDSPPEPEDGGARSAFTGGSRTTSTTC